MNERLPHEAVAAGHYAAPELVEVKVRRGLMFSLFAVAFGTLVGLLWRVGWVVAPDALIDNIMVLQSAHAVVALALDAMFIVGVFLMTTWTGPARKHATWVRVCAFAGPLAFVVGVGSSLLMSRLLDTELFATAAPVSNIFIGLLGAIGGWAALFFCTSLMNDRGSHYGGLFVMILCGLIGFAVLNAAGLGLSVSIGGSLIPTVLSFVSPIIALIVKVVVFMATLRKMF